MNLRYEDEYLMIRRLIYWLLVAAFIWLVASRIGEISDFSHILAQGHFQWVLVAVALQLFHYFVASVSYRSAFTTVGVQSRVRDLFPLVFGSMFVNVVAPAGGASGAALFVDHAARNGQSTARTAAGVLLQLITSLVAFVVVLTAGLAYLGVHHKLESFQVVAAFILILAILIMAGALLLAMKRPVLLRRVLSGLQVLVNSVAGRIKKVSLLSDEWIEQHVSDFIEAGAAMAARPSGLAMTLGILLFAHIVSISVLYTLFLAFSQAIPIGSLVAGYAIGILFLIVSVTPQGVGIVEGVMPLAFGSLGVPNGIATLTVLAFRGLTFWLPLVLGFLLLRRMKIFHLEKAAD